jgi:hypothetical protein
MQKELRQMRQDMRELKSAQISLAVGTNQQSVRVMEHQALLLAEISRLLQGAGISSPINLPTIMYLGNAPNASAMSMDELAVRWPRLVEAPGDLERGPTHAEGTTIAGGLTTVRADDTSESTQDLQVREVSRAPGVVEEATREPAESTGPNVDSGRAATTPGPETAHPLVSARGQTTPGRGGMMPMEGAGITTTALAQSGPLHFAPGPTGEVRTVPRNISPQVPDTSPPANEAVRDLTPAVIQEAPGHSHGPLPYVLDPPTHAADTLQEVSGRPPAVRCCTTIVEIPARPEKSEFPSIAPPTPLPLSPIREQQEGELEAMQVDVPVAGLPELNTNEPVPVPSPRQVTDSMPPRELERSPAAISGAPTAPPVAPTPVATPPSPQPSSAPLVVVHPPHPPPVVTDHQPSVPPVMLHPQASEQLVVPVPADTQPPVTTPPPTTPARGTKRGRSSSVVSTRSSKRLRGETPL